MKINHRQEDQVQVFEVDGEVDFHTSPELRERLQNVLEKKSNKILISLKKVRYIDSSGLATFVEALQKIKRYQGKLVISDIEPQVKSIFEIAKLDSIFAFAGSLQEAFTMLNSAETA